MNHEDAARILLKEARYWLRLIAAGDRESADSIGPLAGEAGQLIAILAAIVRTARANALDR